MAASTCGCRSRARHAFLTTKGSPRKIAAVSPGSAEATRATSTARRDESAVDSASMESTATSRACPDSNATVHDWNTLLSVTVGSRLATGQVLQESERTAGATAVTRAVPARRPPAKSSTCMDRSRSTSILVVSSDALSVYAAMMTTASAGEDPTTNSAGPADESHADGEGVRTGPLSGGGTTAIAVSFRPGAGSG